MKKIFLTILIITLSVGCIYAQKGFSIIFIAQPQNTWGGDFKVPSTPYPYNSSNSQKFVSMKNELNCCVQTGISLSYGLNKNMGFSLGIAYSPQGQALDCSTSENDINTGNITINTNYQRNVSLNYLKIPVQFYFNPNPEKKVSFSCSAGFYLGFLLNYNDVIEGIDPTNYQNNFNFTASGNSYTYTTDYMGSTATCSCPFLSKPYKPFDMGATLSAGFLFKLSDKISIPIMLNYQFGLIDIKNHASSYTDNNGNEFPFWDIFVGTDPNQNLKYYNSLLGLSIGLKIKL